MSELPGLAKWRTSALRRFRKAQLALGVERVSCRYFGARYEVSLREGIGYDIATRLFEYRNLDRFLKECTRRRPTVFADVGANIGLYTCAVGMNGSSGGVIAFEPEPDLFGKLARNVSLNQICVDLHQAAVGATDGEARLKIIGGHNRGLSHVSESGDITVPMRSLDRAISVRGAVIAIKIDVEGFELDVLAGAKALFKENTGYAQIEAHGERKQEVTEVMAPLGWRRVGAHGFDVMFEK